MAVVVFSQSDKLFTYSNVTCTEVCSRFLKNPEFSESKGPDKVWCDILRSSRAHIDQYAMTQNHDVYSFDDAPTAVINTVFPASGIDRITHKVSTSSVKQTTTRRDSERSLPRKRHETIPRLTQRELRRNSSSESAKKRARSPVCDKPSQRPKSIKCDRTVPETPFARISSRRVTMTKKAPIHARESCLALRTSAPMSSSQAVLPAQNNKAQYEVVESQRSRKHLAPRAFSHEQDFPHAQALPLLPHIPSYGGAIDDNASFKSMTCEVLEAYPLSNHPVEQEDSSLQEVWRATQPSLLARATHPGPTHLHLSDEKCSGPMPYRENDLATWSTSSDLSHTDAQVYRPRISTNVNRPFYNWASSEIRPHHATSMSSGQSCDTHEEPNHTDELQESRRDPASGPSMFAGVLEDFSPTTAQWLFDLPT